MPSIVFNIKKMSPNFQKGRNGQKVLGFVIHTSEGNFSGGVEWCMNPASKVSYHYLIAPSGANYQLVETDDTAWHAGERINSKEYTNILGSNPNYTTIGISFAGYASAGPNREQMCECSKLLKKLAEMYKIKLDKNTVVPHNAIRADKICPGLKVSIDTLIYLGSLS